MDTTNLVITGLNVNFAKNSPTKKAVILNGGVLKQMPDGKNKLNLLVEIDGKQLPWIPNIITLKNLQDKYGTESNAWVGKVINLNIQFIQGREGIVGVPQ